MWGRRPSKILIVAEPSHTAGLHPPFLHQQDIRTLDSRTGSEALALAKRERPQLIIQDLDRPLPTALEELRAFRADPETRSIPLIAVAEPEASGEAIASGADAVVTKPLVQREYWDAVRRFVRLPRRRALRRTVNLRFIYEVGGRAWQAFSQDLSTCGAFLKTDHVVTPGTHLTLRFHLPGDSQPIECSAIVRHACGSPTELHPAGFAVEFEGLDDAQGERLERFISRHIRRAVFSLLLGIVVA